LLACGIRSVSTIDPYLASLFLMLCPIEMLKERKQDGSVCWNMQTFTGSITLRNTRLSSAEREKGNRCWAPCRHGDDDMDFTCFTVSTGNTVEVVCSLILSGYAMNLESRKKWRKLVNSKSNKIWVRNPLSKKLVQLNKPHGINQGN
jgi:hypothetical protein